MEGKLLFFVRAIVLVVLYFICFATVSSALFQLPADQQSPAEGNPALALLVVSFLNTILLTYVIIRSRWAGLKLIAAIFLILFGISTFMGQIETAYFVTRLPPGMLPRVVLSGGITAALFSVMAVVMLGKRRQRKPEEAASFPLHMSLREWAWKLSLIAIAYLVIYFNALGGSASSLAGHALDSSGCDSYPHDKRSSLGDWANSWTAVCGTNEYSIANSQSVHAVRSAYGASGGNRIFQSSIRVAAGLGVM